MTQNIDLHTPLSLKSSFMFPLQSPQARREVLLGGLWLFVPGVGWLMNMGHRIMFVHQMMHGQSPSPAWDKGLSLLKHGLITFAGMIYYYTPAAIFGALAQHQNSLVLAGLSGLFFLMATIAIPGYMSHYCRAFEAREIFNPFRALRRCLEGGTAYWHAWMIALCALASSFVGLLGFGVGFLVTSTWFWQVAGFSFASVFTQRFSLAQDHH